MEIWWKSCRIALCAIWSECMFTAMGKLPCDFLYTSLRPFFVSLRFPPFLWDVDFLLSWPHSLISYELYTWSFTLAWRKTSWCVYISNCRVLVHTHVGNSTLTMLMGTKVWHRRGMFDSCNKMKYLIDVKFASGIKNINFCSSSPTRVKYRNFSQDSG